MQYAGFFRRTGAFLIDGLLFIPFVMLNTFLAYKSFTFYFTMHIFMSFSFILYEIILLKWYGATLGKMALHIKVIKTSGENIGWREAILRNIVGYLSYLSSQILIMIVLTNNLFLFSYNSHSAFNNGLNSILTNLLLYNILFYFILIVSGFTANLLFFYLINKKELSMILLLEPLLSVKI